MANENKEFDFRKLLESTADLRRRVLEGQEPIRGNRVHSEWVNRDYSCYYDDNKGTWWIEDEEGKEVARGEYGGAGATKIDHIEPEVINLLFEHFTDHGEELEPKEVEGGEPEGSPGKSESKIQEDEPPRGGQDIKSSKVKRCQATDCKYNQNFKCTAPGIEVGLAKPKADCLTYQKK